jgi:hypothetical protein
MTPQLPAWVSYLQALAIPIVGLAVTAAGALIALAQLVIARDRFEVDAFDRQYARRLAVYEATRQFLAAAVRETRSEDDIRAYGLQTLDAQFLFDDVQISERVVLARDDLDQRQDFSRKAATRS